MFRKADFGLLALVSALIRSFVTIKQFKVLLDIFVCGADTIFEVNYKSAYVNIRLSSHKNENVSTPD